MTCTLDEYFVSKVQGTNQVRVRCSKCATTYLQSEKMWKKKLRLTGLSRCSECSKQHGISRIIETRKAIRAKQEKPEFTRFFVRPDDFYLPKTARIEVFCLSCEIVFQCRKDHIREKYSRMGAIFCISCAAKNSRKYDRDLAYEKYKKTMQERYGKCVLPRKEVKKRYDKNYSEKNRETILKKRKAYADQNKDKKKLYDLAYREANKKKISAQRGEKLKTDINFKIRLRLRQRLGVALRTYNLGRRKAGSSVKDLGCTIAQLIAHFEKMFQPGMTWNNWGRKGWHIDHIVPLSKFDLTDEDQFKVAVHYTNLRPLWWRENISKGNRSP